MDLSRRHPTDVGSERPRIWLTAGAFTVIACLATIDLLSDFGDGTSAAHALVESSIILASATGLVILLRRLAQVQRRERDAYEQLARFVRELDQSRTDGAQWRAESKDLLAGLGTLIDR